MWHLFVSEQGFADAFSVDDMDPAGGHSRACWCKVDAGARGEFCLDGAYEWRNLEE